MSALSLRYPFEKALDEWTESVKCDLYHILCVQTSCSIHANRVLFLMHFYDSTLMCYAKRSVTCQLYYVILSHKY